MYIRSCLLNRLYDIPKSYPEDKVILFNNGFRSTTSVRAEKMMRKRTIISWLFYFFVTTNARKGMESNKTLSSVRDAIEDMVRTFALSEQNGPLKLTKRDKGKIDRNSFANVLPSMLTKMFDTSNDDHNSQFHDMCHSTVVGTLKSMDVSEKCYVAFDNMICEPLINATTITDAIKNLLTHSPIIKMLDAWQKIPDRILRGNTQWIGSFEECSNIPEAKYCASDVKLGVYGGFNITYGSCFPKECATDDVGILMNRITMLLRSVIKEHLQADIEINHIRTLCDDEVNFYTLGWIVSMGVVATLVLLSLVGTTCELIQMRNRRNAERGSGNEEFKCGVLNPTFNAHSQLTINQSVSSSAILNDEDDMTFRYTASADSSNKTSCNHMLDMLICFSLIKNSKAILSTRVTEGMIMPINGIRVISLTWVILGNYHLVGVLGLKTDNILDVMGDVVHRFSSLVISTAYVAVDSFFVLSGFLVSYLTLKRFGRNGVRWTDILQGYWHRYVRLTPQLGLMFGMYYFLPEVLRGPMTLKITQTDEMSGQCEHYWYSVIFYFNNFYPSYADGCLPWTYYLANDMQFFLLSPALILVMVRIEKLTHSRSTAVLYNFLFLMSICVASILTTGIITYTYDLPSIPTTTMLLGNPYGETGRDNVINMVYMKPYCRITPYLVGLFLGYLISKDIKPGFKGIGKIITVTGWVSAIVGGLVVVYGPWQIFKENGSYFTKAETALFAACHRFIWGCAVAWVIYACHNRCGGFINWFLSWKIWMPLSRLTYSAFLIHLEIIYIHTFAKETPIHYQINETVFSFISITVITYASAFAFSACVEYPILHLEKFFQRFYK